MKRHCAAIPLKSAEWLAKLKKKHEKFIKDILGLPVHSISDERGLDAGGSTGGDIRGRNSVAEDVPG
jgi:hypothetical protein